MKKSFLQSWIFNLVIVFGMTLGISYDAIAQCAPWSVTVNGSAGGTGQATANYICDPNEPLNVKATPDFNGHPGLAYLWNTGATTQVIPVTIPGIYAVTVSDDNGCTGTASFTVVFGVPAVVTATASPNPAAPGTTVTVTVTGTFAMMWSHLQTDIDGYVDHPFMLFSPTETWTFLMGTTDKIVQYQGHDDVGCGGGGVLIVTAGTCNLVATATATDAKCHSETSGSVSLVVAGAVGSPTYAWSNGATTKDLTNVGAGMYSVTVTEGSCITSTSCIVNEPSALVFTTTQVNVKCNNETNGAINIIGSGGTAGYTYSIDDAVTFPSTTGQFSSLGAGEFKIVIKDSNGCITKCQ